MKNDCALPAVPTGTVKASASKYKGLCHHCHKPGHYRPDCPDRAGNKSETPSEEQPTTRTVTSSGGSSDSTAAHDASDPSIANNAVGRHEVTFFSYLTGTAAPMDRAALLEFARLTHAEWLDFIRNVPPPTFPTPPTPSTPPVCLKRTTSGNDPRVVPIPKGSVAQEVCSVENTFYVEIRVGRVHYSALLDTGSEVMTLIPKRFANAAQIQRSTRKLRAANGTEINLLGEWKTTFRMGGLQLAANFLVSDQIDEILIGIDWMRENKCLLSFDDFTITLHGKRFPLLRRTASGVCHRVVLDWGRGTRKSRNDGVRSSGVLRFTSETPGSVGGGK